MQSEDSVMRHEDMSRLRGLGSLQGVWFRVRLWLRAPRTSPPVISDLSTLSEHQRQDIGLAEPNRYVDWKALQAEVRFPDFTR
jgi:hypothetical protein